MRLLAPIPRPAAPRAVMVVCGRHQRIYPVNDDQFTCKSPRSALPLRAATGCGGLAMRHVTYLYGGAAFGAIRTPPCCHSRHNELPIGLRSRRWGAFSSALIIIIRRYLMTMPGGRNGRCDRAGNRVQQHRASAAGRCIPPAHLHCHGSIAAEALDESLTSARTHRNGGVMGLISRST